MQLFAEGKVDAFLGFPPEPQELRARRIGHVVVNSAVDQPVVAVFLLHAGRQPGFRASASDRHQARDCAPSSRLSTSASPSRERVAQRLVEDGFTKSYDYALQTLTELPYRMWREYDPEDTLRFYALRLHEIGMIKSSPNKIIAEGTDWRFLERAQARAEGVSMSRRSVDRQLRN